MSCTSPLAGSIIGGRFVFGAGDVRISCGQCMGCRLERARQWSVRCFHESKMHDANSFITLTYHPYNLPDNNSLYYPHFQLFMKRLRKYAKKPVRFYMCGEYGDTTRRPHYHACLFGLDFVDRKPFATSQAGFMSYTSDSLQRLWPHGHAWCADFSFETAGYVARYVTKKLFGKDVVSKDGMRIDVSTGEVIEPFPEFTHMSLKPGIGRTFYDKYSSDFFPHDRCIVRGSQSLPPRYYSKIYKRSNPEDWERISKIRQSRNLSSNDGKEGTPDRRRQRAIVTLVQSAQLKRKEI